MAWNKNNDNNNNRRKETRNTSSRRDFGYVGTTSRNDSSSKNGSKLLGNSNLDHLTYRW